MKMLYSGQNSLIVNHLRNLLESQGIACRVKNEFLAGGAGEIPVIDTWPELWVEDDNDYERAGEMVRTHLRDEPSHLPDWDCPRCGERIEGQFTACWNCGQSRPENTE
jgi:hypothetical protein